MTIDKNSINRRKFLKRGLAATAGVALFPTVVPASAMGRGGYVAPSDRIVMGAIGVGAMGSGNMRNLLKDKRVQYVAVCDVDDLRCESGMKMINEKYGNNDARSYRLFTELLEKENLDAVSMALPDHWHGIIGVAAAAKGLDIYGEKPLARTIYESRQIVDAAQKNNIVWQTGSWQRSRPNFYKAAKLVRNGVLGKIHKVEVGLPNGGGSGGIKPVQSPPENVDFDLWLGPAPKVPYRGIMHWNWRWIMAYSGGQLTDWAGHHVDIAHWGLDYDKIGPVEIEGVGVYPHDGIYDVPVEYNIKAKYESGIEMQIANTSYWSDRRTEKDWHAGHGGVRGMGTAWFGEHGWIHVNRQGIWASNPDFLNTDLESLPVEIYKSNNHHENFVDCILSRKETITPAETAHRSISVALAGEIAMLTGEKLKWDYKNERFTNSDHANRLLRRPFREPWKMPEF